MIQSINQIHKTAPTIVTKAVSQDSPEILVVCDFTEDLFQRFLAVAEVLGNVMEEAGHDQQLHQPLGLHLECYHTQQILTHFL